MDLHWKTERYLCVKHFVPPHTMNRTHFSLVYIILWYKKLYTVLYYNYYTISTILMYYCCCWEIDCSERRAKWENWAWRGNKMGDKREWETTKCRGKGKLERERGTLKQQMECTVLEIFLLHIRNVCTWASGNWSDHLTFLWLTWKHT